MLVFFKVLRTLFSCNARIETLPFVLLPTLGISINNRGNFDYEGKTILKIFNAFSFFFRRLENKYALGNLKKFMNNFLPWETTMIVTVTIVIAVKLQNHDINIIQQFNII